MILAEACTAISDKGWTELGHIGIAGAFAVAAYAFFRYVLGDG